jgi:NAD(P)-dependent dehydrogenase (short-subunit alcohol dehydrogenase family)
LPAVDLGLQDRVCIVTGSTAGIGLETARLLASEGARVVVNGRGEDRVRRTASRPTSPDRTALQSS